MKVTELKQSLAAEVSPCYLLVGDDDFLIKTAVKRFISLIDGFEEMNYTRFDETASVSEIKAAASALPFMSSRRVIEVAGYTRELKDFAAFLDDPPESSVVLFTADTVAKNFSAIIKKCVIVDCSRLDEGTLLRWISKKITALGGKISTEAASELIRRCNRFLFRIENELDKLFSYRGDEMISIADVTQLVSPDPEFKIYELGDAAARKDKSKAMEIYYSLLENMSVAGVFGTVYSHFRRLLYVAVTTDKDSLAGNLGVKDYAVKMAAKQAAAFSPIRLKRIVDILHALDAEYKRGLIQDKLGMEKVIMQILAV